MIRRLLPYAVIFLALQTTLRLSLLERAWFDVEFIPSDIFRVLGVGLWFDAVTAIFLLLAIAFFFMVIPSRLLARFPGKRVEFTARFLFCYALLFDAVAEHLFWSEFSTRFNFIAVDYLIYTQEVIGNIAESYPLFWLLLAIAACAAIVSWVSLRIHMPHEIRPTFRKRAGAFAILLLASGAVYSLSNTGQATIPDNAEASELAANGIYNLFAAFWNNEISYTRFYATRPDELVHNNARHLLWEQESDFVTPEGNDLTRAIRPHGSERRKNVVLVVMESMSADYMGAFGNKDGLTPNLDRLAKEGLLFSNLYATGTRTVRGLEAVTLSIPPTPGQSIIRRPNNSDLFSLGFIFQDRGYDTNFIYGGYGYFDNMNTFFSGNGFSILDRSSMTPDEIQFANVWGICDEDMFARSVREADRSFAEKKPFMHLIMTTSNHRPYTYPEGRIDIAPHSGRLGGVKYADYSVGKLIETAKTKPWFKDTVFVFVADHTAGAGGKAELDPRKYHIPLIFYAPGFIKPGRYEKIASQIDTAPVLLGLINFSYYTKFFGENLLNDADEIPHAFISNYQKVALVKNDGLTVLAPKRSIEEYSWPEVKPVEASDEKRVADAITYYQSASWWREQYRRIPTVYRKR